MNQLKIALLGFGNVGQAFVRYINDHAQSISIRAVADSSGALTLDSNDQLTALTLHKTQGQRVSTFNSDRTTSDIPAFIRSLKTLGVSCLVESLPTNIQDGQPALGFLSEALSQGINIVTVDKGPLVHGFDSLRYAAAIGNARLAFTGTTGVAIPDELAEEKVLEIRGVLNGTTNYILTAMQEQGLSFHEALAIAQRDGIAEPNPALDVEGWDTACKILILAKALMDTKTNIDASLAQVSRIGLSAETQSLIEAGRKMNRTVRLIGRARIWQGRLRVSVAPKLVDPDSPFYSVSGTSKLAVFRTPSHGEIISTSGSGRDAISQVILEDILKVTLDK
jgi:homoserine dehydrogenase